MTVLITGASTGIGATYADRFARRGHDLILVARDEQRLEEVAARLRSEAGVAVEVVKADLTAKADLSRIEKRLRTDQTITVLVNNAGVSAPRNIVGGDVDRLEALIQLNVLAPTRLAAAAANAFSARGNGTIINVGSVLGLAHELSGGPYSGSKAYLQNFSLVLSREVSPNGVYVQLVLPGATRTAIWEKGGVDINSLPAEMVMEVDELVDAAMVGFDRKELVTIPSLPDVADWTAYEAARTNLRPNLSRNHAAERYLSAR
jgi:short-subunit dehydrogenase